MPPGQLAHPFAEAGLGAMLHGQVVQESAQVFGQVAGAGIAAGRVEARHFADQGIEAPGDLRASGPERRDLAACGDHQLDRLEESSPGRRCRRNGCSPASISKKIKPECVDVGAFVDRIRRRVTREG